MQSDQSDNYWQPLDEEVDEPVTLDENIELDSPDIEQTSPVHAQTQFEPVHWQAYENLPEARSTGWYIGFGVITLLLMTLAVVLIKSITFTAVIAAAAAALVVYVRREPRQIHYTLDAKGLHIGDELRLLSQYKAFGIQSDRGYFTLTLLPTKRFMPALSAYFPEEAGEQIVDILSSRMPMQKIEPDIVDRLIRKLRL